MEIGKFLALNEFSSKKILQFKGFLININIKGL